ncbi:FAD linked oxidase domain protein [Kribbella flavida DSM 17836]|uniref:FAD linked oxidase domain protein n=1 Tax=Kribbella flavida (strain DSM 17836 / JCM 10339 / NBRC 14399) TaxID=479435 RepID=D2PPF1_KRIFD|nr:FAD-binding protein [Kribbella flavida]ADB30913.1 FAD linked oxidase domain protein [Kribbella flavida DSM 17836]
MKNWAGNITFSAAELHRPRSVDELAELVGRSEHVRVLGTGHSFNRIADTTGTLVSVADLPKVIEIAPDRRTVRVSGGLRYGEVTAALQADGLALHNLGSLPHISVAGACSTGTHGSGDSNGTLASAATGIEFVAADGSLVTLDRRHPDFAGAVVALGALGVTTHLTLAVEPAYEISQVVYDGLPVERLGTDFDTVFGSAYSVSAFTDWADPEVMVWRKAQQITLEPEWLGARLADGPRHPIKAMPADFATEQGGVPGPWNARLPHFRLEFTPSNGEELQSEYFLPREQAAAGVERMRSLGDKLAAVVQVSEVRTIAADRLWLSPSQGRATVAFHFTWIQDETAVRPVVEAIEDALLPLGARPHWGKVFAADAATLRACYPLVPDFTTLAGRLDPTGKFRNDYLNTYLPAP